MARELDRPSMAFVTFTREASAGHRAEWRMEVRSRGSARARHGVAFPGARRRSPPPVVHPERFLVLRDPLFGPRSPPTITRSTPHRSARSERTARTRGDRRELRVRHSRHAARLRAVHGRAQSASPRSARSRVRRLPATAPRVLRSFRRAPRSSRSARRGTATRAAPPG